MRGALFTSVGTDLEIVDDLALEAPRAGEVRVEISNCGICHSDLTIIDSGHQMPVVLGHEAAGVVDAVGDGVSNLKVGDHVLVTPLAPCGQCKACARGESTACPQAMNFAHGTRPDGSSPLSRHGEMVYRGLGVGGFAEATVVAATGAVKIDPDLPLDVACVAGCSIQTGVGAVFNSADVERGATVLVLGLGGIGQSIVQGAAVAGARRIIVSDPVEARREAASGFGATDLIDPTRESVAERVAAITAGEGVDYAFEAAGIAKLIEEGMDATRIGGATVMVGAPAFEQSVTIPSAVLFMTMQKKLIGSLLGGCVPQRDIPLLMGLWQQGSLDFDSMITSRIDLDAINDGINVMRASEGVRTIVSLAH